MRQSATRHLRPTGLLKAGILAIATVVALPVAGHACNVGSRTDGRDATWCFTASMDGKPLMRDTARWALNNLVSSTVMTATPVASCDPAVNPGVDYRFADRDLGAGVYGSAECQVWSSSTVCGRYRINANRAEIVAALSSTDDMYSDGAEQSGERELNFKANWCHELGHTVSLEHHPANFANRFSYYNGEGDRARDCMVRGHVEVPSNWLRYNAHHVSDVASRL